MTFPVHVLLDYLNMEDNIQLKYLLQSHSCTPLPGVFFAPTDQVIDVKPKTHKLNILLDRKMTNEAVLQTTVITFFKTFVMHMKFTWKTLIMEDNISLHTSTAA